MNSKKLEKYLNIDEAVLVGTMKSLGAFTPTFQGKTKPQRRMSDDDLLMALSPEMRAQIKKEKDKKKVKSLLDKIKEFLGD